MENSAQLQAGERARGCSVPQAGPEPAAGAARGGAAVSGGRGAAPSRQPLAISQRRQREAAMTKGTIQTF